jgi:cell division initiation protein
MKVLVEKIEEYRATEDAMRMALLSAQKMANQIVAEAKENSEAALSAARAEAEKLERAARAKVSAEEAKLTEAQRASAKYIENLRLFSQKHLEFLEALSEQKIGSIVTPPPAAKKASRKRCRRRT